MFFIYYLLLYVIQRCLYKVALYALYTNPGLRPWQRLVVRQRGVPGGELGEDDLGDVGDDGGVVQIHVPPRGAAHDDALCTCQQFPGAVSAGATAAAEVSQAPQIGANCCGWSWRRRSVGTIARFNFVNETKNNNVSA